VRSRADGRILERQAKARSPRPQVLPGRGADFVPARIPSGGVPGPGSRWACDRRPGPCGCSGAPLGGISTEVRRAWRNGIIEA
jgi:hypothetical protein